VCLLQIPQIHFVNVKMDISGNIVNLRILAELSLAIMVELAQLRKTMKPLVNALLIGKAINAKQN